MNRDFEEFFALLNARRIEYLIIGGVAYNYHAPPRATKDIDVWVRPQGENLKRLLETIAEFGFPTDTVDLAELENAPRVLMLGRVPYRIDILTRPDGLDWEGASAARVEGRYGETPVFYLSRKDLIANKRAAGRPRDLADVATLEEMERLTESDEA